MAGKTNPCLKVFLIVVNFLFLIVGVAILAVGIYLCTQTNFGKVSEIFAGLNTLRDVRFNLIGSGVVIMLVAMCGFFGACKENRCLIVLYLIFLILILIANVAAVALSIVYHGKVKEYMVDQVKDRLKRYYGNTTDEFSVTFTKGIDDIQTNEKCCGWNDVGTYNIFTSTPWYQQQAPPRHSYPDSCCPIVGVLNSPENKILCVMAKNETEARKEGFIYEEDCPTKLVAQNSVLMRAVLGTVILAMLMQIICIVCSIVLMRQISNEGAGRMV